MFNFAPIVISSQRFFICISTLLKKQHKQKKEMEGQEQLKKSKVIKIDSRKSWEYHISYATNQSYPVVVHFSAFWCVPSIVMNPFFEELASTYQDVLFLTLDVDEVKEIASKLEIKAMPTFLLLNGGVPMDKIVGANPDEIKKRVDHFIHSTSSQKSKGTMNMNMNKEFTKAETKA